MARKTDADALVSGINSIRRLFGEEPLSVDEEGDLRTSVAEVDARFAGGELSEVDKEVIRKKVLANLDPRKANN